MNSFLLVAIYFLCGIIPLYLFRVIKGPDVFDRLIGLNGIATKAILLLLLISAYLGQLDMIIDICLGYGLLNLVGSLAIGKFLEHRGLE